MNKNPLIVLTGPTAVGKTALSIKLAKKLNAEIISADSMQVYRHMDIGTAKIKESEMCGITHHLIDILEPQSDFNVTIFKELAKAAIEKIYAKGKLPIVVGGTGFYIQALLYDIDFTMSEETNNDYRSSLNELARQKGASYLHEMLRKTDPKSAELIHPNNVKRVIRALEYFYQFGRPISEHNEEERAKQSAYDSLYFVLNDDREKIYERIDMRVEHMIDNGLEAEVKNLLDMGLSMDSTAMQGIGYKEMAAYINGEISRDEAIQMIKLDTRHFAKRQLTWFKRERDVIWLNYPEFNYDTDLILLEIVKRSKEKGI